VLYRTAAVFLFLSRYEGFGFPVIESMAIGTPIIHSTASCLAEIAGAAGCGLAPDDIDGISREGGIHFPLVGPICWGGPGRLFAPGWRGGLPADAAGVRRVVLNGEGLCRLPAPASLAERLSVPGMRWGQSLNNPRSTAVCRVPAADLGGRRDHLRGHAEAAAKLVQGDVVRDQPEARR
jgi:hypothetical protein